MDGVQYIGPGKLGAGDEDIEPMIIQGRKVFQSLSLNSSFSDHDVMLVHNPNDLCLPHPPRGSVSQGRHDAQSVLGVY